MNVISGDTPTSYKHLSETIRAFSDAFSFAVGAGAIPGSLGKLENLVDLQLHTNNLEGLKIMLEQPEAFTSQFVLRD